MEERKDQKAEPLPSKEEWIARSAESPDDFDEDPDEQPRQDSGIAAQQRRAHYERDPE